MIEPRIEDNGRDTPRVTKHERTFTGVLAQICSTQAEHYARQSEKAPALAWYYRGQAVAYELVAILMRETVAPTISNKPPISLRTLLQIINGMMDLTGAALTREPPAK